jgi:hypothetical protein
MDVRNAYEEFLAIAVVATLFLALGYVLLTGYGLGHYMGERAEASGYPGVHVIREEITSFAEPVGSLYGSQVRVIHKRLRPWQEASVARHGGEFNGGAGAFPL